MEGKVISSPERDSSLRRTDSVPVVMKGAPELCVKT